VSAAIAKQDNIKELVIHTGQHFDSNMSDVFFMELGMASPAYHLDIHGGPHGEMTGRMLAGVERILVDEAPDVVLVYGDTNSTLAGSLAAAKLHIPVAHVEAGLRSFNMSMPEEVNRILTDRLSTWLFAPSQDAVAHLKREGIDPNAIHQVGDVMYDVALYHGERAKQWHVNCLERAGMKSSGYVLVTIHRAENTDEPLRLQTIVKALVEVSRQLPVVWPLHPRTRASLERVGLLSSLPAAIQIIDPLGYMEMVQLEQSAAVIATDSGGVQKEAFFHGVPCVTLRDETEWVELINSGWNRLAPPLNTASVATSILSAYGTFGDEVRPYGEGNAAELIVQKIMRCPS